MEACHHTTCLKCCLITTHGGTHAVGICIPSRLLSGLLRLRSSYRKERSETAKQRKGLQIQSGKLTLNSKLRILFQPGAVSLLHALFRCAIISHASDLRNPVTIAQFVFVNCRELAGKLIVMLKRISEAKSPSKIESTFLASETNCSHHSTCNFSQIQNTLDRLFGSFPLSLVVLRDRANGGIQLSKR
jgi:hypothetical protein